MVNPMLSPAFTEAASAVLAIWMVAQFTVTDADELSVPSLVVVTSPVLFTVPQLAEVVVEVMCTVNVLAAWVVPAGTVTGPQFNTPVVMAHVPAQPAP